jgi:hypothetical protein
MADEIGNDRRAINQRHLNWGRSLRLVPARVLIAEVSVQSESANRKEGCGKRAELVPSPATFPAVGRVRILIGRAKFGQIEACALIRVGRSVPAPAPLANLHRPYIT